VKQLYLKRLVLLPCFEFAQLENPFIFIRTFSYTKIENYLHNLLLIAYLLSFFPVTVYNNNAILPVYFYQIAQLNVHKIQKRASKRMLASDRSYI